ncbi:AfsA-related hotdog domain-containing protein [Streptomyces kunmingensis]|uniref:AfsA-related hotdog domain-containing protein n=1 Tax=Streptomyces kunmingensis TaxID=68225 RepID=A0ABU6CQP8_9ACTN|nr:AfsA-related hotdog domain-containing protein [Streptomyces kunmingensis]MEB3967064.1 AfsA-related hotdog domain-containing protein [Streptomyces kunmingensis]
MPSATQPLLLVGDRFAGFTVQDTVRTVTQLIEDLHQGVYSDGGEPIRIRAGQGVTLEDYEAIWDEFVLRGLSGRLDFPYAEPALAGRGEAHKHCETNTLIANLRRDDDTTFAADLRLHNDNEILLDHQTGEHVQGMVAVEAARQMFLAVSERFFASHHPQRRYYYVIESMHTDFENFLFPLDASIEYRITRADTADPARLAFTADVSILQAGRRSSVTAVAFTAFEAHVLQAKEHRRAEKAVAHQSREAVTAVPAPAFAAAPQPALAAA